MSIIFWSPFAYNTAMPITKLSAKFHTANRRALAKTIGDEAIAIIDTADVLAYLDNDLPFRPDPNFYYLSGVDEPEAVLVLVPGHANPEARELLFISGTSDHVSTWEGERLTPEQTAGMSGVNHVLPLDDLDFYLDRLLTKYQIVYLNAEETVRSRPTSPALRRAQQLRERAPLHQLRSATPALGLQRATKAPAEIALIRQAVDVTAAGLRAAWAHLEPGRREYELEAELTAEFIRRGATHGFSPIVAAGRASTIMHYTRNRAQIADGDLVLIDVGAQVDWYSADISRVVPAGGHFSERQRAVYEAVLKAQKAGFEHCRPGASVWAADEKIREVLTLEIKKLGLKEPLRTYYPTISHHLGLDLHDTGDPRLTLAPGMVVTCEPGLYLRDENIGVRIEDDLLITKNGPEVLSAAIPKEPAEIEAIIQDRAQ
jgi:Xaa-Pro aminopeptidase